MGEFTGIGWTLRTFNPWRGCKKVSPGCANCLHPDTLVLYEDWIWRPLKNVKKGDRLIGFTDGKGLRKYKTAIVEGVMYSNQEAVKFKTNHTEIICSKDHRFLAAQGGYWYDAESLSLGKKLRYIPHYPELEESFNYKCGYITAMTKGDGTNRWEPGWGSVWRKESPQCYWRVAVSDMPILVRLQKYLLDFEIELDIKPFDGGGEDHHKPMYKLETRSQPYLEKIYNLSSVEYNYEFARGWLAGIFDAEGSHNDNKNHADSLRISNTDIQILNQCVHFGKILGFDLKIEPFCLDESNRLKTKRAGTVRLYGTCEDRGRFLGIVRPALQRKVDGLIGHHASFVPSPITAIELLGKHKLIDIQTSTGNFYANGLKTHNCYMFTEQYRYKLDPTVVTRTKTWNQPRRWQKALNGTNKKEMVFTCSWSDFFIQDADEWRPEAWKLIKETPNLIYQVLTKRPELIPDRLPPDWDKGYPNVALGVSIENADWNERADDLRTVPARWRFISAEPLLGSVKGLDLKDIHWLIAGGESGPGFRVMDLDWVREARDMCVAAKVPFFYKQDSGPLPGKNNVLDGRTWEEWPAEWLNS